MRYVLAEQWGTFKIAYLDDIIIFSDDWRDYLWHTALVFERLAIYGLTVSPQKCSFGRTNVPYLGHVVSADGNSAQPRHIEAIKSAKPPRTRKELQSFIGISPRSFSETHPHPQRQGGEWHASFLSTNLVYFHYQDRTREKTGSGILSKE